MAQKDKVKELVGRGLGSYHTKALQQMDRIEKKNKEQNHKISILSNELDNDYLTKTEEGSVISLEHSKEGMVYLDELQGNTLVNYCTDGSKEMTLNGDIDVEGTFVTTTEGVDNGKVDVICEGNTLVNKLYKIKNYGSSTEFKKHGWSSGVANCNRYEWLDNGIKIYSTLEDTSTDRYYRSTPDKYGIFKKNRTYIVRMNVNSDNFEVNATILRCFYGNGRVFMAGTLSEVKNGVFVKKATTSSEIEECDAIHSMISLDYIRPLNTEGWVSFQNVMVVDVTDLPSYQQDVEYWRNMNYFEGMKSVGQEDINGHKIEILSQNKNLIHSVRQYNNTLDRGVSMTMTSDNTLQMNGTTTNSNGDLDYTLHNSEQMDIYLKPNKDYVVNFEVVSGSVTPIPSNAIKITDLVTGAVEWRTVKDSNKVIKSSVNPRKVSWIRLAYSKVTTFDNYKYRVQIEEGNTTTSYVKGLCNKKEISLNEPLRSLPNGVKDKIIKIGSKYYVERNCDEINLTPDLVWQHFTGGTDENFTVFYTSVDVPNNSFVTSNIIPTSETGYVTGSTNKFRIGSHSSVKSIRICIETSKLNSVNIQGFKEWLQNNQVIAIYQTTPTYELLEIEPNLNTYNDTTHISNNSTIPCNMKIKNTGYNAIIKPSTLYTVALDTNKTGTIGMNLGGAKVTTTNNVATITTPATLIDDSLRLYGKGIKGSKVRLLEGDKTNWIPSHFEGMKSSFEDKVQSDGSYKMEILSNNKNLFDIDAEYYKAGWGNQNYQRNGNGFSFDAMDGWSSIGYEVKGHRDKTVVVSATVTCINKDTSKLREQSLRVHTETWSGANGTSFLDGETKRIKFNVKLNHEGRVYFNGSSTPEGSNNGGVKWTVKDILIEDVDGGTGYFPRECNKIQFSSIEPLRSVKNIKDKFVFKDGKLMIERNCIERDLTRTLPWSLNKTIASSNGVQFVCRPFGGWGNCKPKETEIICSKKPTLQNDGGNHSIWVYDKSTIVLQMNNGLIKSVNDLSDWLDEEKPVVVVPLVEPTYEEVPFELQKIILEGYENGTLFIDTNIPPTVTTTYAGETPIVKSVRLNKTEVLNNTEDINDNIIPYLMDMDYRVVMLQLATEELEGGVSMARLFGGTYEMIKRDILSKRLTREEYGYRLADYFNAGKLTEEQVRELEELR